MRQTYKRIHVRKPPVAASATGAVGPGHGRRRVFGTPDRDHGRDTEVADMGRDMTRRDPSPDDTARDAHPRRRIRRRAIPQRRTLRDGVTGDRRYGTRRSFFYPTMSGCPDMPGYARLPGCPDMPGCSDMSGCPVARLPGLSGTPIEGLRAAQRLRLVLGRCASTQTISRDNGLLSEANKDEKYMF